MPKVSEENKRDKFVRIAEARTIKIISMLRLLGNCSNQSVYEYSEKDVQKIFAAIETATADTKRRFKSSSEKSKKLFSLD